MEGVYVDIPVVSSSAKKAAKSSFLLRKRNHNEANSDSDASLKNGCDKVESDIILDIYDKAKLLFHRGTKARIVGRTMERAAIERFLSTGERIEGPRVLYICGNPGTGKTALMEEMLGERVDADKVEIFKANCMMQGDARQVLQIIAEQLNCVLKKKTGDKWHQICDAIEDRLCKKLIKSAKLQKVVLILDEVDQIGECDKELLKRIFNWPYLDNITTDLRVIGIANSLDLSIKYFDAPPSHVQIVNFSPYTVEDITRILIARLEMLHSIEDGLGKENRQKSHEQIINPVAIEICSRKVSGVGDLRKALEIMRDGVCLAQKESLKNLTMVKVDIKHIVMAMESAFGTTVRTCSRHTQLIQDEMNLHQKLLLTTLYRVIRDSPSSKPTVQTLYDLYSSLIKQHRVVEVVSRSEFHDLVSNTESMGVISLLAPGKRVQSTVVAVNSDTRLTLRIPLDDVSKALSENAVLKQLLS